MPLRPPNIDPYQTMTRTTTNFGILSIRVMVRVLPDGTRKRTSMLHYRSTTTSRSNLVFSSQTCMASSVGAALDI